MRADLVINALEYAGFLADYQETYLSLNKDSDK
jgi:hypothetical protein